MGLTAQNRFEPSVRLHMRRAQLLDLQIYMAFKFAYFQCSAELARVGVT